MKNKNTRIILIVVVTLVLLFVISLAVKDRKEETASDPIEEETSEAVVVEVEEIAGLIPALGVNMEDNSYLINAENQLSGGEVMISSVFMPETGWVAVRENIRGNLGNVLGAARLESGNNFNVLVSLQRGTVPNEIYHIVLYRDNGDRVFTLDADELILSSDGNLIVSSFKTFE